MLTLGIITGSQGVTGKLFIPCNTDIKIDLIKIHTVNIGFSEKYSKIYHVKSIEKYNKGYLLQLKEIESKEQAEKLKEQAVFISEEFIKNKKNVIGTSEIIGYKVYDDITLEEMGVIHDILHIPSHDVLVVNSSYQEILIPFIDEYVSSIDKGKVLITVVPGLLDVNVKEGYEEEYG
ncbi:MAG: ribosome maturation factor RimM [bacterium]